MTQIRSIKTLCAALMLALPSLAVAQQAPKPTAISIDGVSRPQGSVTVGGKVYISLDALKAAGVTVISPTSVGIYNFKFGNSPVVKLSGCMNE